MPTVYKRCGKSLNVNEISEGRHAAVRLVYNEVHEIAQGRRTILPEMKSPIAHRWPTTGQRRANTNSNLFKESPVMTIFAVPIFDATVVVEGNELFKGQGSATQWAERLAVEVRTVVTARKIGNGWALCGSVDGVDCIWGIYGQRLKRIN